MVGVGEIVGVEVSVGVRVSVSVGGIAVNVEGCLVGVTGGEGLKIEYKPNANSRDNATKITEKYLATGGGSFLSSFSVLDSGISGCGVPPSASSNLFTPVA